MSRWEASSLSQPEPAALLGMSERTFHRWIRRYEVDDEAGLADGRLDRRSGRAVPVDRAIEVARLYQDRYQGFTAKHFHQCLVRSYGFRWGYSWTRRFLQGRGLIDKAPRRSAHRRKRPRRPMVGMMLHQDGSSHPWLAGRGKPSNHQRPAALRAPASRFQPLTPSPAADRGHWCRFAGQTGQQPECHLYFAQGGDISILRGQFHPHPGTPTAGPRRLRLLVSDLAEPGANDAPARPSEIAAAGGSDTVRRAPLPRGI
jgi:transposase